MKFICQPKQFGAADMKKDIIRHTYHAPSKVFMIPDLRDDYEDEE